VSVIHEAEHPNLLHIGVHPLLTVLQ